MRPTWLALVLAASASLSAGCATLSSVKSAFTSKAAACDHMEQTTPDDRLRHPCRYADSMATCFDLPDKLRKKIARECEAQRAEIVGDVLGTQGPKASG